jgi:hypothetical protein
LGRASFKKETEAIIEKTRRGMRITTTSSTKPAHEGDPAPQTSTAYEFSVLSHSTETNITYRTMNKAAKLCGSFYTPFYFQEQHQFPALSLPQKSPSDRFLEMDYSLTHEVQENHFQQRQKHEQKPPPQNINLNPKALQMAHAQNLPQERETLCAINTVI